MKYAHPGGELERITPMTRRRFLQSAAAGVCGLTIGGTALADPPAEAAAENVIMLWMDGGPSHVDTFDPKPGGIGETRGQFSPIRTNVPGLYISELLPRMARQMHRCTLIRTLSHTHSTHERACHAVLTGREPAAGYIPPSIGSLAARELARAGSARPYAALPGSSFGFGYGRAGSLGRAYDPITDLEVRDQPLSGAYDLDREAAGIRVRYGSHPFGEACLTARRLVERGAGFVTVSFGGWDTHTDNALALKDWLAPTLDQGMSALIEDLHNRGLLSRTLVVWMGEFGRSPHLNALAGRDHWPSAGCALFAGAGVPGGQVVGTTDPWGAEPVDRAIGPAEIAATVYAKLGIHRQVAGFTHAPISELC